MIRPTRENIETKIIELLNQYNIYPKITDKGSLIFVENQPIKLTDKLFDDLGLDELDVVELFVDLNAAFILAIDEAKFISFVNKNVSVQMVVEFVETNLTQ